MLEAVIFDMDGLMFDTEPVWDQTLAPALATQGLEPFDGLMDKLRGSSGAVLCATLRSYYGDDIDAEAIGTAMHQFGYELFQKGCPQKPYLMEMLNYLKERGIKTAVASSSEQRLIDTHLSAHDLYDYFDVVISGHGLKRGKPYPDIFLKAAEALGSTPENTVVLEDSIMGMQAGIAGGFKAIMIPDRLDPTPEVEKGAYAICDSLGDAIQIIDEL